MIRFINHASILLDEKILCDPWYSGSIFLNSWNLLYENNIDINSIIPQYIWFSHEHPDHFNPPDLLKIEEDKKPTILFQKTDDKKVKSWCEHHGFKVKELEPYKRYNLKEGGDIMCGVVSGFDSFLHYRNKKYSIFNANDCQLYDKQELKKVKEAVGEVDYLFTQFGFANWAGNKGDSEMPKIARKLNQETVRNQIEILQPKYVVPFACFVYYSHEENFYWNKNAVNIKMAYDFLTKELKQNVIVPTPGAKIIGVKQKYNLSEKTLLQENVEALDFWSDLSKNLKPKNKAKKILIDYLQIEFGIMRKHILRDNSLKTFNLSPTVIYLTDLNKCVIFDIKKPELEVFDDISEFDVSMSSECLDMIMKHPYGRGTITINGRFTANYKRFNKFLDQTNLYYYNNIGRYLGKNLKISEITNQKNFYTRLLKDT
tara:strand:- start:85 stop:1371 length:1287 start_codon:yes stop_codon:yes gene_type:complete